MVKKYLIGLFIITVFISLVIYFVSKPRMATASYLVAQKFRMEKLSSNINISNLDETNNPAQLSLRNSSSSEDLTPLFYVKRDDLFLLISPGDDKIIDTIDDIYLRVDMEH